MIDTLQHIDRPTQDRIVKGLLDQDLYLLKNQEPIWQRAVRYWRLFMADRDDPRDEAEKRWRANVFVPYPFSTIQTQTAVQADIFNSTDAIQAEGVGDEDQGGKFIERLFDYQQRRSGWRKKFPNCLTATGIQGTDWLKLGWVKKEHEVILYDTPQQKTEFLARVLEALQAGAPRPVPDAATDPEAFEVWREIVNSTPTIKNKVPPAPYSGRKMVVRYQGPSSTRVPFFELRYDPLVEEVEDQPVIIHRMLKTKKWLMENTGLAPHLRFSPEAVARVLHEHGSTKGSEEKFNQYQREINRILNMDYDSANDPLMKGSVEIHECFVPGGEFPYAVILNQTGLINKDPLHMPYMHGEVNLIPIRNIPIPGFLPGLSELQQPEAMFYELNALRNLRLDGVTLSVLPVFQKLINMGVPELLRKLSPGLVVPVSRMDAIKPLLQLQVPNEAFREPPEIKQDIDETTGTTSNIRGQTSTVGRVSATENQQRFNSALIRPKLKAVLMEEDLNPYVRQSISMWYQFSPAGARARIGGAGKDPWVEISPNLLLEAMEMDYRFRGATKVINRELNAQQLMTFVEKFANSMIPPETRAVMKEVAESLDIKNIAAIVSETGTKDVTEAYELTKQQAKDKAAAEQAAAKAAALAPPTKIDPAQAATVEAQMTAGSTPAGTPPPPSEMAPA